MTSNQMNFSSSTLMERYRRRIRIRGEAAARYVRRYQMRGRRY
jgi:hypothetical protein